MRLAHGTKLSLFLVLASFVASGPAHAQAPNGASAQTPPTASESRPSGALPAGVILVKGAVPGSTDSVTPLPEDGKISGDRYENRYFRLNYPLPAGWIQRYSGPPPSDTGNYVLTQLERSDSSNPSRNATILITAQDLFFGLTPVRDAREAIQQVSDTLQPYYKTEHAPAEVRMAGHSFARFDYVSPVAALHWYVLATQIRCHVVRFVYTGQDVHVLESLIRTMDKMALPAEAGATSGTGGGDVPVCVADYASGDNVIHKIDPILTDRAFNPIPVRVVIDREGNVKHVHTLSAFPEQARIITEALQQWKLKPYVQDGQAVEVETGIMFGWSPRRMKAAQPASSGALDTSH